MHVSIRYLRGALLALLGLLLASPLPAAANTLEKNQLGQLLDGHVDDLARGGSLRLTSPTLGPVIVESTLHRFLQQHTMEMLRGVKSRRAAVVVMEADTGRVLVLAGMKAGRLDPEVALEADAPAASLFKIVTAAAALERTRIDPDSELRYTGRPHTLYKNQVSDRGKAKGQKVSLKKGFADSNNPIFARLGMQQLGAELLTSYAKALGFERPLPFEVPVAQSNLPPVRDQFNLAELACGYHRETTISPLHAAVLVSIFLNDGRVLEPYMVRQVSGMGGEVLYQGRTKAHTTPLSKTTCQEMQELFEATVSMGTARRAFNKVDKDKVLRKMELGGKTGTLRGPDLTELFEWFAGYGRDPATGRTLAVATLVAHGQTRLANPKVMARQVLTEAFKVCSNGGQYLCSDRGVQPPPAPISHREVPKGGHLARAGAGR